MNDICQFIPPKEHKSDLSFLHFVYETDLKNHKQPFVRSNYYMHVVFKGKAIFKTEGKSFSLNVGDVFITAPFQSYTLEADNNFSFMYISFNGDGALPLLNEHSVSKSNCVFIGLEHIISFWVESIRRIKPSNANTVTESVFLFTLSFIEGGQAERYDKIKDKFDSILDYINLNFTSSDLSLKKLADLFFYTEKHLSRLFTIRTGKKFTQHVNALRIDYSVRLLNEGKFTLDEIAVKCGYRDKVYFSKVFKKLTGKTPTEYSKEKITR
ncbi:MAG: helix-turn-helix domain-containing protein [Clostridia bacterium]|nr:helix-turn-helix domain-containing protein [Clostridia bacterium]